MKLEDITKNLELKFGSGDGTYSFRLPDASQDYPCYWAEDHFYQAIDEFSEIEKNRGKLTRVALCVLWRETDSRFHPLTLQSQARLPDQPRPDRLLFTYAGAKPLIFDSKTGLYSASPKIVFEEHRLWAKTAVPRPIPREIFWDSHLKYDRSD